MQVCVRGLGSHARRATPRAARAASRRDDGDGDGSLADGRTPVECRAHRVPPKRRQRHAARVEPVGRGAPAGRGIIYICYKLLLAIKGARDHVSMLWGERKIKGGLICI